MIRRVVLMPISVVVATRVFAQDAAAGIADLHFHPALPRTVRVGAIVGF